MLLYVLTAQSDEPESGSVFYARYLVVHTGAENLAEVSADLADLFEAGYTLDGQSVTIRFPDDRWRVELLNLPDRIVQRLLLRGWRSEVLAANLVMSVTE